MLEPWSKFFWSDYDADEGLRMCSLAAQGLWMRMLCLMARATPKGELKVGSQPCTASDLSRVTGESEETVADLIRELDKRGVFSRTRAGVIYSRRLRNDEIISKKRAKAGAKGAYVTNMKTKENQDLLRQSPGKPPGKASAPYARSHIPDTYLPAKSTSPAREPETGDGQAGRQADSTTDLAGELSQLVGLPPQPAATAQVERWLADGIEPETCRTVIQTCLANGSEAEPTRSLKRYDAVIRAEHAKGRTRKNGANPNYVSPNGYVYRSADPKAVMREAEKRADWTTYYAAKAAPA